MAEDTSDTNPPTVDICVDKDMTVIVRDRFSSVRDTIQLYGDIILKEEHKEMPRFFNGELKEDYTYKSTVYGGEGNYFKTHIDSLNPSIPNGVEILKEGDDGVRIEFKYKELKKDTFELNFCGVWFDSVLVKRNPNSEKLVSKGWCPDKTKKYVVRVTKKPPQSCANTEIPTLDKDESNPKTQLGDKNEREVDNGNVVNDGIQGACQCKQNSAVGQDSCQTDEIGLGCKLAIVCFIILCLCLIIAVILRMNKLSKKIDRIKTDKIQSLPKTDWKNIEEIKNAVISQIGPMDLEQRIREVITGKDIQNLIQTVIENKANEYLRNNCNNNADPVPSDPGRVVPKPVETESRTTNIEYRANDNCFVISENPPHRIFEVYLDNGGYYYTIVKDANIRRAFLGVISSFRPCVEIISAIAMPSTVEVLKDGRLRKDGDKYFVDTANILQISLK